MVPLMCYLTPKGLIHLSGGTIGNYEKSLSGSIIPDGSELIEIEKIVPEHTDINDYHIPDLNHLQWEDWSEVIKFAQVEEVMEYVITPMKKNNTSHNNWKI
tara:strand:+ start:225 stop:527 length:303 start_codon:yes stop_codon:yes gene_type:complete